MTASHTRLNTVSTVSTANTANTANAGTLNVGDLLPPFETEPISRLTLALYCGASGDHNPIHVDTDFARAAGMPDVFAHGMLSMAWLARLLTNWTAQSAIRDFSVRFAAITQVGERITCAGRVVELLECDGERRARIEISTTNQDGQIRLTGEALIALA
jgi:acyl dehydratase